MTEIAARPVVLVVDDECLIRLYAVDILSDAGCATIEAGDAAEALSLLACHPEITVLFTDINMPGPFDGLELARQVHAARSDIQLIVTSGRVRPNPADLPGNGNFVAKPYEAAAITKLIRVTGAA